MINQELGEINARQMNRIKANLTLEQVFAMLFIHAVDMIDLQKLYKKLHDILNLLNMNYLCNVCMCMYVSVRLCFIKSFAVAKLCKRLDASRVLN